MLIGLRQIIIQALIEYAILAILFLCLASMQPQSCPHLNKDGTKFRAFLKGFIHTNAVPLHDTPKNMLEPSPDDSEATAITE